MGLRIDLHNILKDILQSENVYFQPPPTIKMEYPCIVYRRDFGDTIFANDKPYRFKKRYQIILIDRNPDSEVVDKLASLPLCLFDRFYTADNLNHDVFKIFF